MSSRSCLGVASGTEKFSSQMPLRGEPGILGGSRQRPSAFNGHLCHWRCVLRRATAPVQESCWLHGGPDLELTDRISVPPQRRAHMGAAFTDIALTWVEGSSAGVCRGWLGLLAPAPSPPLLSPAGSSHQLIREGLIIAFTRRKRDTTSQIS